MDATSQAFSGIRHRIGRLAGTGVRHGVHSPGRIVPQRSGLRDGVVIVLALVVLRVAAGGIPGVITASAASVPPATSVITRTAAPATLERLGSGAALSASVVLFSAPSATDGDFEALPGAPVTDRFAQADASPAPDPEAAVAPALLSYPGIGAANAGAEAADVDLAYVTSRALDAAKRARAGVIR